MKPRLKKAALLALRKMARPAGFSALYYWSELRLHRYRCVCVMPTFYYRRLYKICMWLVEHGKFRKLADIAIHTIPYQIRFEVA